MRNSKRATCIGVALLGFLVGLLPSAARATPESGAAATGVRTYPWEIGPDGWHFYQDPAQELEREVTEEEVFARLSQIKTSKEIDAELHRLRDKAILEATEANLKEYMYAQKFVMEKATVFADVWRRVVFQTDELNYSLVRPVNAGAIHTYRDTRKDEEDRYLRQLGQAGVGLFFFYSSTCPYCIQMAPIMRHFEERYGMKVLAISMDGGYLPEFPAARPDNGISVRLNVGTVPALFVADAPNSAVVPVGAGMMSEAEIVERIMATYRHKPGTTW